MSLTPPSSHGSGPVTAEDINSESSSAGEVLTSNGDGTASWATSAGGGSNARVDASLNVSPFGELEETATFYPSASVSFVVQGPPLVTAAMGTVCATPQVVPADIPDIEDNYDVNCTLYVTDPTGANTLTVSGGSSQATPISGAGAPIDWTGTSATIVGVDLAWDGSDGVTSTAGGVYSATLLVAASGD